MSQEANQDAFSALRTIHQKETEIRQQVAQAQQRAAALIQTAREEAKQRLTQAEAEAQAEAERLYQDGLKEARETAEILLNSAYEQAASLRQLAQARRDEAASQLVRLILPAPREYPFARSGRSRQEGAPICSVAEATDVSKEGN